MVSRLPQASREFMVVLVATIISLGQPTCSDTWEWKHLGDSLAPQVRVDGSMQCLRLTIQYTHDELVCRTTLEGVSSSAAWKLG